MYRTATIVLLALAFFAFKTEKFLKIPLEGIKTVNLVLKDQLTNAAIETYELPADRINSFVAELNKATEAPSLKMNITCYRFDIVYTDGRVIELPTNGKGLGPTPVGYFLLSENLVLKYFPITKEKYCKPTKGGGGGGGGFGF